MSGIIELLKTHEWDRIWGEIQGALTCIPKPHEWDRTWGEIKGTFP